jgi:hypothetical protein
MHEADDEETLEEIRARRSQWPVRKGRSQDLDNDEPDLSLTTTVEQRFAMMWQLAKDGAAIRGEATIEPGLSRHSGRLIRRRS